MNIVERTSTETSVIASFAPDRKNNEIRTDYPFLTHMINAFACHGNFPLSIDAKGDTEVDIHHLVEDSGYAIGKLCRKTFSYNTLLRSGSFCFPMDEALARVSIDLSGRPYCLWQVKPEDKTVMGIDVGVFREFFTGFCRGAGACIHISLLNGTDAHHSIEAVFKAFGRALSQAVSKSETARSTKGVFDD